LEFEEEPDYEYLENLLILIKEKYELGEAFEWQPTLTGMGGSTPMHKVHTSNTG